MIIQIFHSIDPQEREIDKAKDCDFLEAVEVVNLRVTFVKNWLNSSASNNISSCCESFPFS